MKKYLIKTPEKYIDKAGVEKTFWHTIGTIAMFETDGAIKIPAIGLNAKIYPVEDKQATTVTPTAPAYPSEELNPNDVPFWVWN